MTDADVRLIEHTLQQVNGVERVDIHQPTRSVTLVWSDPATWDDFALQLDRIGFTPDLHHPDTSI
jgi:hypothetical protein